MNRFVLIGLIFVFLFLPFAIEAKDIGGVDIVPTQPCSNYWGPIEPTGAQAAGPRQDPGKYMLVYAEVPKSSDPIQSLPANWNWSNFGPVNLEGGKRYFLVFGRSSDPELFEEQNLPIEETLVTATKDTAIIWDSNKATSDVRYAYCLQSAGLVLSKKASDTDVWARKGSRINYSYILQNNYNMTLYSISLTDSILGNITLDKTVLRPGESAYGSEVYELKVSDLPLDNSSRVLTNTAIAQAIDINGVLYNALDEASVNIINRTTPDCLELDKRSSQNIAKVGDEVIYSYTVANNCDITLYEVMVTDNIRDSLVDISLSKTTLRPNEKATGSYSIKVVDSDLPGPMINHATVTAYDIDGNPHTNRTKVSVNINETESIENSIILLFDASGSMADNNKIDNAKTAAKNFLSIQVQANDEVALIVFYDCSSILVDQPFTTDKSAFSSKIDSIQPSGSTPLYAAVAFARDYMNQNANGAKKKIIQFTDGLETCGGGP